MHSHRVSLPLASRAVIIGDIPLLDRDFDPFDIAPDEIAGEDTRHTSFADGDQ